MPEYGSGPSIDQNFDLEIDTSGDIDATSGPNELRKDLAFSIGAALTDGTGISRPRSMRNGLVGEVAGGNNGVIEDAEQAIERVAEQDPRVDAVLNISASIPSGAVDSVDVSIRLLVDGDAVSFDRVFTLD